MSAQKQSRTQCVDGFLTACGERMTCFHQYLFDFMFTACTQEKKVFCRRRLETTQSNLTDETLREHHETFNDMHHFASH